MVWYNIYFSLMWNGCYLELNVQNMKIAFCFISFDLSNACKLIQNVSGSFRGYFFLFWPLWIVLLNKRVTIMLIAVCYFMIKEMYRSHSIENKIKIRFGEKKLFYIILGIFGPFTRPKKQFGWFCQLPMPIYISFFII